MSCNATPARAAKYLDSVTNRLIQGEHRKTWNIVISYDEVSQLYCCKLMPLFGIFERRIRELVYITIIKIFGVEWYDNSFSKSLQDGLVIMEGVNGHGKSTFMNLIYYGFGGRVQSFNKYCLERPIMITIIH